MTRPDNMRYHAVGDALAADLRSKSRSQQAQAIPAELREAVINMVARGIGPMLNHVAGEQRDLAARLQRIEDFIEGFREGLKKEKQS